MVVLAEGQDGAELWRKETEGKDGGRGSNPESNSVILLTCIHSSFFFHFSHCCVGYSKEPKVEKLIQMSG